MPLFDAKTGDLVTFWKSKTGVTSLIGAAVDTRAYPEYAKEEAPLPLIVYNVAPGGQAPRNLSGGIAIRSSQVNVWTFGATRAAADALAEAVRQETENYRGYMGSTYVYDVRATSPDTGAAPHADGSQAKDYWARIQYEVWYSVTAA